MADDSFNVDALLDDIDEAMGATGGPATIKFTPHPPNKDKSPSKHNNPKTKFTVTARSGNDSNTTRHEKDNKKNNNSITYNNDTNNINNGVRTIIGNDFDDFDDDDIDHDNDNVFSSSFGSTGTTDKRKDNNTSSTNDENSLDNLLEMLKNSNSNTPQHSPVIKATYNVPITGSPLLATSAVNTYGGVFSPEVVKAGMQKASEYGLASHINATFDIDDDNDFDDVTSSNGNNDNRTCSSHIESNENSNRGNIAGSSSSSNSNSNSGTKLRCSRVYVAGPSMTRGLKASVFSKCVCNNLMCINCNFKVLFFHNKQWNESADYMFFRNNFPNESKLSSMITVNDENTAYCCQCSWIHVKEEKEIHQNTNPKWICAGHYDK